MHVESLAEIATHNNTITYSNSPIFSYCNFLASNGGVLYVNGMSFINGGSVTGSRYIAIGNALITTGGASSTYIPGSVAGSTSAGGTYY